MTDSRLTLAVLAATVKNGDILYEGFPANAPFGNQPGALLGRVTNTSEVHHSDVVIHWRNPFGEQERREFASNTRVYVRTWP